MKGYINIFKPFDGNSIHSYETSVKIYPTKQEAINSVKNNDDLIIATIKVEF